MLIRSNTGKDYDPLYRQKSNELNSNLTGTATATTTNSSTVAVKPPQNRYEAIFIKLFAQTTLKLIITFTTIFLSLIVLRDLIGLRIKFLKFSFWFQFAINSSLLIALIFAKMKCISNVRNNPLSNPFEYFFNQDQLILIGVWTAAAFNFGSWYFRQYAPHLYKLFDHVKGKHSSTPVLREEYFLLWATLLSQGIVSWSSSFLFSTNKASKTSASDSKLSLFNFLKSRFQDVTFWPNLLNRSALIYVTLILIHFTCSWLTFPIFGLFLSGLIEIKMPVRHSWTSIFRIGIFVHSFTFSVISNLIYALIDWLIEFYLERRTFRTSSLVSDSESCLTVGLCETKQPFIHLQACQEFLEIATESNGFRRYKIFSAVKDEGSLSREILEWFCHEMNQIQQKSLTSLQELNSFFSLISNDATNANANELPNPEVFKQYREKTIGVVELILKKIFTTKNSTNQSSTIPAETNNLNGLPEVFARRGANLNLSEQQQQSEIKKESVPLIFEFGPFLRRNRLGRLLISHWIASRKVYPIERFEMLEISIKSIAAFICASFVEDESGQVQLILPKVLESSVSAMKSLQNLLESPVFETSSPVEIKSDELIENLMELLKEMLKGISETFGETLENLRISSQCREFINSL